MARSGQLEAIRTAFSSGEFHKARKLWEAEAGSVCDLIARGKACAEDVACLSETLAWARLVTASYKAQAEATIAANRAAGQYNAAVPVQPITRALL